MSSHLSIVLEVLQEGNTLNRKTANRTIKSSLPRMAQHYLLWASGEDRPGIVASVTKVLFRLGTNLEDSSMMRLGSEFAIFLIFTASKKISEANLNRSLKELRSQRDLSVGIKPLSSRQALYRPPSRLSYIVSVHGQDRPGIVFRVTEALARKKFNVTDLSTHRTGGRTPGYILFLEGELTGGKGLPALERDLERLARTLKTKISLRPVDAAAL
jgi:glycine cleavage system transcriptional repressor